MSRSPGAGVLEQESCGRNPGVGVQEQSLFDPMLPFVQGLMSSKAIKFATKHNEVISTMCHGVRLALLIPKLFLF